MRMTIVLFLLWPLSSFSENHLTGACGKSGPCISWKLNRHLCEDARAPESKQKIARIIPTEKLFVLRMEAIAPDAVRKSVSRIECDPKKILFDVIYEFERTVLSSNGAETEFGILSGLSILSSSVNEAFFNKCDPDFAKKVRDDVLFGDRLEQETARTYYYRANRDTLDLFFADKSVCPEASGLVHLIFSRE